ncbi:MAG TPA: CDP-diacylglycerol--serine O-phosphatidyltransferase [Gemmatimonadales bacterium]|nr:CDP-diacylglycerol--serine O-phosphatidyltransferase [Gemmatimonadales bacterium]
MSSPPSPLLPREGLRRVVVVIPSAFTLGNLFLGFWSIISAFNGNFRLAGWLIFLAAVLDSLDGRVARRMGTGSRFGAELDSLVDMVSFGVAPALLIYFLEFSTAGRFGWIVCFIFVVAAALRLARFNVLAHGRPASRSFIGLPSPAAGTTLATFHAFSQTGWYGQFQANVDLSHQGLVFLLLLLAALMVSRVEYPRGWPVHTRSVTGVLGLLLALGIIAAVLLRPSATVFPILLGYIGFGLVRHGYVLFRDRGASE